MREHIIYIFKYKSTQSCIIASYRGVSRWGRSNQCDNIIKLLNIIRAYSYNKYIVLSNECTLIMQCTQF